MDEYRVTLGACGLDRDFVFVGGPIEDIQPAESLFGAIGYASAQWARLEQHIDAILMHVNNKDHSDTIFNPNHPMSFDGKIKHLKRWFNQHPALSERNRPIVTAEISP